MLSTLLTILSASWGHVVSHLIHIHNVLLCWAPLATVIPDSPHAIKAPTLVLPNRHRPTANKHLPTRVPNLPCPNRYIPFSGGPRKCVGDQFALMEAGVALSVLLKNFDFEVRSNFPLVLHVTHYPQSPYPNMLGAIY